MYSTLAVLMDYLDGKDIDHHGLDGWTVKVEKTTSASGTKLYFTKSIFDRRSQGKGPVLKYFGALRDAPLPGGMALLHPRIVLLRALLKST